MSHQKVHFRLWVVAKSFARTTPCQSRCRGNSSSYEATWYYISIHGGVMLFFFKSVFGQDWNISGLNLGADPLWGMKTIIRRSSRSNVWTWPRQLHLHMALLTIELCNTSGTLHFLFGSVKSLWYFFWFLRSRTCWWFPKLSLTFNFIRIWQATRCGKRGGYAHYHGMIKKANHWLECPSFLCILALLMLLRQLCR